MADANIEMLRLAAARLGELADDLVFVGGCTTGLFITDGAAAAVRSTKDVDVIVEALTYSAYTDFEGRLQKAGFRHDLREGAPICRWTKNDTVLDVMPINGEILGFTNIWYSAAVESAEMRRLNADVSIRVVTPVYFFATKLEAFNDRGKKDFLGSHDLEDLIAVVNGREELPKEIERAADDVRTFIAENVSRLLSDRRFLDSLPGHLMPDADRTELVIERLQKLSGSGP